MRRFQSLLFVLSIFLTLSNVLGQDMEELKKEVVKLTVSKHGVIETGAGIIVGADSSNLFILTALHVVVGEDEEEFEDKKVAVKFQNFRKPVLGKLYSQFDQELDLALVTIQLRRGSNPFVWANFKLGNLNKVKELHEIIALGHPGSNSWHLSKGSVGKVETNQVLFSGDAVHPGNSGGALLNSKGHLIGIVTSRSLENGFAVRMDVVLDKLGAWNIPVLMEMAPGSKKWWWISASGVVASGITASIILINGPNGPNGLPDLPGPPDPKKN